MKKCNLFARLTAVLMAFCLMLALVPGMVFAKTANETIDPNMQVARSVKDYLKDLQSMVQDSSMFNVGEADEDGSTELSAADKKALKDPYATGRILVMNGEKKALPAEYTKKASETVSYLGNTVLQFGTEKDTKNAYKALAEAFGEENVVLDRVFQAKLPVPSKTGVKAESLVKTQALTGSTETLSWGVKNMGLDTAQKRLEGKKNKQVTVAILDTGINYFEPYLQNRIASNAFDFILFNPYPEDFNGHGTHCAGIVAEGTPSSVKIMPVKVMNALGMGSTLAIYMGLLYAYSQGADVYNLSLATSDFINTLGLNDIGIDFTVNYFDVILKPIYQSGAVVCVAAGNDAADTKYISPASSNYVITVAALKKNNRVDRSYSNFGSSVDFAAPGTDINSTYSLLGLPMTAVLTGTSMASPHVAAAAAIVKTYHPDYNMKQVRKVLQNYCVDIETKGKDKYSGYGRINLANYRG